MLVSSSFYKYGRDAADFVGMSEDEFRAAVDEGRAPRPVAMNVPDECRFWRTRDLESFNARKSETK